MRKYEHKLKNLLESLESSAKHLSFNQSCHSVAEAASAAGCSETDLVKNICMIDEDQNLIVAIVKGEHRVSTSRVAKALNIERPRTATPEEILERTGFPCGGTPSFGYQAVFLIDPKVLENNEIYTGGGSPNSLVRITSSEMVEINGGVVVRVRK